MKLYVWNDAFEVDYGDAMCFSVAETEEEARRLLVEARKFKYGFDDGTGGELLANGLKAPDRVLELPAAEWHWWQE